MAFCGSCGNSLVDGTTFCPHCGAPVGAAAPSPQQPAYIPAATGNTGMQENVAAMLCYAFGWLTGIIFFFIDKRPTVRFHAAQSIVLFGGLHVIIIVLHIIFGFSVFGGVGYLAGFSFVLMISTLLYLLSVVLWIVMMITAFQGKRIEIPVAATFAKQLAGANV